MSVRVNQWLQRPLNCIENSLPTKYKLSIRFLSFYQAKKPLELTTRKEKNSESMSVRVIQWLQKPLNCIENSLPKKTKLSIQFLSFYQAEKPLELTTRKEKNSEPMSVRVIQWLQKPLNCIENSLPKNTKLTIQFLSFYQAKKPLELTT
jgi:hypothetical protein